MLFVSFMKPKGTSTTAERTKRRLDWTYPQGMRVVAEYWLPNSDTNVVLVSESDDPLTMIDAIAQWDDVFDITVVPAVTAEAGIAHARERYAAAVA